MRVQPGRFDIAHFYGFAGLLNAIGTGFYFPFALILFSSVLHQSYAYVGFLITVTTLLSLPFTPIIGRYIDVFGSKRTLVGSLVIRALAFSLALLLPVTGVFLVGNFIVMLVARIELSAAQVLAYDASDGAETPRWLAISRAVFSSGYGVGVIAAGIFLSIPRAPVIVVGYVNVTSFLLAALVYALIPISGIKKNAPGAEVELGSGAESTVTTTATVPNRRSVDWRYVVLMSIGAVAESAGLLLETVLAVFLSSRTEAPVWLASMLLVLNAVLLGIFFVPVSRRLEQMRQLSLVFTSCGLICLGFFLIGVSPILVGISLIVVTIIGMLIYSAGELISTQALGVLLTVVPGPATRGRHLSMAQLFNGVGAAMVPWLAGWIVTDPSAIGWWLMVLMVILAALVTLNRPLRRELNLSGPVLHTKFN